MLADTLCELEIAERLIPHPGIELRIHPRYARGQPRAQVVDLAAWLPGIW
jgi:hypothetical protein